MAWIKTVSMILLLCLIFGCGEKFLPVSVLDDLRVLAILSDPLEAGPEEDVILSAKLFVPAAQTISNEAWTFCPFTTGPFKGYECLFLACEVSLTPDPDDGKIHADPWALTQSCISELSDALSTEEEEEIELPETIEVVFRYHVQSSAGTLREALQRMTLWTSDTPTERNRPPKMDRIEINGKSTQQDISPVAEGEDVHFRIVIDPESLDTFTDEAGRERMEEPFTSFYTTTGRFEYDRTSGVDTINTWHVQDLSTGEENASIYVTLRDGRGGQSVEGPFLIPIAH